ncbi:hypothetical protein NQ317_012993 [Molorchus minor]|uniref:Uncharacterized protein n=1 Tax=Molorchus minor TaxID=1323400 RepID=A0ABQ9JDH9_9CUCU|nr:hypothetical protein NQ317_012993 [Molorchus minor]
MARQISEDVSVTLKELVKQISGIKEDSDNLGHIEKQVITKFLLCLSERPTSNFLNNPEEYKTAELEEKEEIDWGEYLKEGIERWSPNFEDTSSDKSTTVDFRTTREELLATIQHTWYNKDRFFMPPPSDWEQANTGILWDKFLEEQVAGLIPIEKASVLSEYKVIREILWQLWIPHTSAVFELIDDKLKPKSNVTISSVRYFFRQFSKSLDVTTEESIIEQP